MKNTTNGFIVLVGCFLLHSASYGIPAFARRYKLSCSTCHAPVPRLKPYGDDFAGNGFILPEQEKPIDYVSAGDDLLWLNKNFPLAVRFDAFAVADQDQTVTRDLEIPWGIKLLSGGALYKNIGYYFYFYMSERGEVAGVEDAYVHFDNVFKSGLDVMVGQFQTSDPLMKRELRLTFEDYQVYRTKIGGSAIDLTYDRGLMFAYAIPNTGTNLVAMVTNGNGKDPASEETKKFDNDNDKNIGFRIAQGLGKFAMIGGFYYRGREKGFDSMLMGPVPVKRTNAVTYYGLDANVSAGPLDLAFQYLIRKDSNPLFIPSPTEVETKGVLVEVTLSPHLDRSRFFWTLLYNRIQSDPASFERYHTATLACTYLVARNLRIGIEATRDVERDKNRLVLGLVGAF